MAIRFKSDQPKCERNVIYLRIRRAISAVQIWIITAFAEVPTKVFIFRLCLMVLKKI
jgi:hypothetical protein